MRRTKKSGATPLIVVGLISALIAGGVFYFIGASQGRKSATNASITSEESATRSGAGGVNGDSAEKADEPAETGTTGSGRTASETTTTTVTTPPTTVETKENTETLAIVKSASEAGGKRYVTLDYVEMLTGEAGAQYLIAKGECTGSIQDCMPENDFVIRNDNPKLRTFVVATDVKITMEDPTKEGPNGKMGVSTMSWSEFRGYHKAGAQNAHVDTLNKTKIVDGVVVNIQEMYTP